MRAVRLVRLTLALALLLSLIALSSCSLNQNKNGDIDPAKKTTVKLAYKNLNSKASFIKVRVFNNEIEKKNLQDDCLNAKPFDYLIKNKYVKTSLEFDQLYLEKDITITPSKIYQGCMYNLFYNVESNIETLLAVLTPTLLEDE